MHQRIDEIDAQIIKLLQEDGRITSAEMVRRIGPVSERVVRLRMKRLLDEHIIRVRAIINPAKIGYTVTADVWIETEASATLEVAAALTRLAQTSYVSYSTGDQNISIQVQARDIPELHQFVASVIGKIDGVRRTTIRIIPVTLKDVDQWELPETVVGK